jgi:oxygen-independent coproporphyrinogen-3 oxidase
MNSQILQPFGLKSQPLAFKLMPPLALYVHVPWCVRKCPYCDFNSHAVKPALSMSKGDGLPEDDYIEALLRDLELSLPLVWGRRVVSVFIGGGTPSLLGGQAVGKLLTGLRMRLPLEHNAEITLEANPGTAEAERFAAYRDAGVNRLSLGIQSFNDAHLAALGRIHDAAEARRAIELAQRHFDNFNLDLMYALPNQTLAEAEADLDAALAFAPPHLSCYHLTLEPNTLFAHQPPPLPDDDESAAMQQRLGEKLAVAGYLHYETSAYAKARHQARHNQNYWQFGDYLGIGAGAHGKLSFHDKVIRQARPKQPQAYLDAVARGEPVQSEHALTRDDLVFEFMMNALRLNQGFDAALFEERTSLPLILLRRPLAEAERRGLLVQGDGRIVPTELGRRFLNDLLEIFLKD